MLDKKAIADRLAQKAFKITLFLASFKIFQMTLLHNLLK